MAQKSGQSAKALTDKGIASLKPAKGERIVEPDAVIKDEKLGGGLYLRAGERSKTFWALYYVNGKPRWWKIGRYPQMTLAKGREACRAFLKDPQAVIERAEVGTFKEVAEDFIKRHVQKKGLRSEHEIKRLLKTLVYPRWEAKPFLEIKRSDVTKLLDHIEDKNGARQADNCLAIIRKLCNWYETRNDSYRSPVIRGMNRRSVAESARHRILDDDEIRSVWSACNDMGSYGALLKLCLLSGQRVAKVKTMQWADVDENGLWSIPTEAREKGNAGELLLPQMARGIIETQPHIEDNPFVFPAAKGNGHFNSFSQRKRELDGKLPKDMKPWVIHDLRRTARSLLSRAGVAPHVAERVLGHAIHGVEGVYDRHQYTEEKGDALRKLASLIETILNPPSDNVIALRK